MATDHDPRGLLDEAQTALDDGYATKAAVLATMAQAAALLMPSPEEVIQAFQEAQGEILGEVEADLIRKVEEARRILEQARQRGPRHPAIVAALEALREVPTSPH